MDYKKIFVVIVLVLGTAVAVPYAFTAKKAVEHENVETVAPDKTVTLTATETVTPVKTAELGPESFCYYPIPTEGEQIAAEFVTVRNKLRIEPGDKFRVKAFVKNTGNTPWFAEGSMCGGIKMSLGTDKDKDRTSVFYNPGVKEDDNNWESSNRVGMDQERINPGEIASFTFWTEAQDTPEIYKEYFTPIANNSVWLDNSQFSFYVMIGDTGEDKTELRKKMLYSYSSGPVTDLNLNGEKKLLVDLSEQKLYMTLDGQVIREFLVSTGAYKTPTPKGDYTIKLKQDVRISGAVPHYVMPKFMWFKEGGYGFHALPSLASDGGVFWTEARNHIGRPVSHGCIRLLPEDADFVYEFTDLGTKVTVQG